MLVLGCSGLFKDYEPHEVQAFGTDLVEMDALSLNYWEYKFV